MKKFEFLIVLQETDITKAENALYNHDVTICKKDGNLTVFFTKEANDIKEAVDIAIQELKQAKLQIK